MRGTFFLEVFLAGVEDGQDLGPFGHVGCEAPFFPFGHFVEDPDVGKGAAHHDFMVAAPAAIAVEIFFLDAEGEEIFAGRRVGFECAGRRDVVGGDRIAKRGKRAHAGKHVERTFVSKNGGLRM